MNGNDIIIALSDFPLELEVTVLDGKHEYEIIEVVNSKVYPVLYVKKIED